MVSPDSNEDPQKAWENDVSAGPTPPDTGETYRILDPPKSWGQPAIEAAFRNPIPLESAEARASKRKALKQKSIWLLWCCNLLVFVSSVCVMTLELTASRLIGKHLGNSLYTWTSVIGVVLAGITVGNSFGGWLADRYEHSKTLSRMFLVSSVLCLSVLWLDQLMAGVNRPTSLSWPVWVLCVVGLIFFLPAASLGTISPIAASMALAQGRSTGTTVGNVYAWGAAGSIVGTFLTGFVLIDMFGTRSIIALTALTLAVLSFTVAGGQRIFRVVVVCGWLQTWAIVTLIAISTPELWAGAGEWVAEQTALFRPFDKQLDARDRLRGFGQEIGESLQGLGILLSLRDDTPGEYHDESQYSYINVGTASDMGSDVKFLRLDKLVHSYFNPRQPTELYYDYEKVYAALTELSAGQSPAPVSVVVQQFANLEKLTTELPAEISFDPATRRLTIPANRLDLIENLTSRSADHLYWRAIEDLYLESQHPNWGGFSSAPLDALPAGVEIPADLLPTVRFDKDLQVLVCSKALDRQVASRLQQLTGDGKWRAALTELVSASRKLDTFFIGGGGYVFPRWIEHHFPASGRIDVAELDPAVRLAVERQLGLTTQSRVQTSIGDARQVIDELLARNKSLVAPVTFNAIYGDAFNDFSVPWHLTTLEFSQKVRSLLSPGGIYLVNIIDAYPRTVYPLPGEQVSSVTYRGPLPKGFNTSPDANQPVHTPREANSLIVERAGEGQFVLKWKGEMSNADRLRLENLDRSRAQWIAAVGELCQQTSLPLGLAIPFPEEFQTEQPMLNRWDATPGELSFVNTKPVANDRWQFSVRGGLTRSQQQRLLEIIPDNAVWKEAVADCFARSNQVRVGRFLARYVNTVRQVFPNIYVFSSEAGIPSGSRDTLVIACSLSPLPMSQLESSVHWTSQPFATIETIEGSTAVLSGQMESVLALAEEEVLTDDFAPVDNLLRAVFEDQN